MKTAFNISTSLTSFSKLFIELSDEGLSFAVYNHSRVEALKIFRFYDGLTIKEKAVALAKAIETDDILTHKSLPAVISCSFPQSVLSPSEFYNKDENVSLLNSLYGEYFDKKLLQDDIPGHHILNDYAIPQIFHEVLSTYFSNAAITHQYSLLVSKLNSSQTTLHVLFYFEKIVIVLFKEGMLQIAQTFIYKTPADILYHLLNVTRQFSADGCAIILYGMIEKQSALYEELYKYFLNISFAELPAGVTLADQFSDYPPHFFAHLFYTDL